MKRPTLRDLAQRHHTDDWRAVPVEVRPIVPVTDRVVRCPCDGHCPDCEASRAAMRLR